MQTNDEDTCVDAYNPVEPCMIEPMTRLENAGYVPFSSSLLWIMTEGGSSEKDLNDTTAWGAAVAKFRPLLETGEIEVIGRPAFGPPEIIKGFVFAGVLISEPLIDSLPMLIDDHPWIGCSPFFDEQHWLQHSNDQLFLQKATLAAWTHLQVKKSDVCKAFVFPKTVELKVDGPAAVMATPRLSRSAKVARFKQWRESQSGRIPTVKEDIAHMKAFSVGRDEVRDLRRGYPSRDRGRPKIDIKLADK
jgi:hypothetical protein